MYWNHHQIEVNPGEYVMNFTALSYSQTGDSGNCLLDHPMLLGWQSWFIKAWYDCPQVTIQTACTMKKCPHKLACASSGNVVAGLKYLYSSQREDNVPSKPTDHVESFWAHNICCGAQLIAMARSAVNPITEMMSRFCKHLLCLFLTNEGLPDSLLRRGKLLSPDPVLKVQRKVDFYFSMVVI